MNETFICGVCGKKHKTVEARANCENACLNERAIAEAEKRKREAQAEQEARRAEVDAAYENWNAKLTAYVKDYGYYNRHTSRDIDWDTFWNFGRL